MSRRDLEALGSQRESLSNNPLLISSELGKPRRRCFTLPPSDFTYGMRSICFDGGAAEALSTWHSQYSKRSAGRKKTPEKDFITLNRLAAQSGLTTAHDQTQFRACHDIRKREKEDDLTIQGSQKFPVDRVFGISTRPSTPIFDLLEHRYQDRWLTEKKQAERKQREKISKKKLQGKIYETRASLFRRYSEPVDPPPLWKLSRFSRIPPTLQTFRSDKMREKALMNHSSDAIARQGMFGHGVYYQTV